MTSVEKKVRIVEKRRGVMAVGALPIGTEEYVVVKRGGGGQVRDAGGCGFAS